MTLISFPLFGPWGRWYPWYGSGFGWNLGYVTYNPWRYGATRWMWGRYGMWYDPFGYSPYYDPFYDSFYYSGGGSRSSYDEPKARKTTGSLRLKVNPSTAKVYVDGVLYGTVDEFNGLANHLEVDGGRHVLELRADGYDTYTREITVKIGKTLTHRATLKKR